MKLFFSLLAASLLLFDAPRQHQSALERVVANDNRTPAGTLRDGVLTLHLEAREGLWFPDEDAGPSIVLQMFGEVGKAPRNPGPLIRVPAGTRVHVSIRNSLDSVLVVHGFFTRPSTLDDTVQIAAGATRELSFPVGEP